jgi:hypothetical protein
MTGGSYLELKDDRKVEILHSTSMQLVITSEPPMAGIITPKSKTKKMGKVENG